MAIFSVSFLITSLIGFRLTNMVLRFFYRITAVWLGFVNYAFFSAVLCWVFMWRCGCRFRSPSGVISR